MRTSRKLEHQREILERIYAEYHRPYYLNTDPLGFVHEYDDAADREVVALIAASFAFGNFKSISAAVRGVLGELGAHPAIKLKQLPPRKLLKMYDGFVYRWLREDDVRLYLAWIGEALRRHGSLEALWQSVDDANDETVLSALAKFVEALTCQDVEIAARKRTLTRRTGEVSVLPSGAELLLTSPAGKSGCKRMNLFLRWVVRPNDGIDLGLWSTSPSRLVMPVDTHVLRMSRELGLTRRRAADLRTALEITQRLRAICPEDPIKYDFSFVRPGMMGRG